MTGALVRIHLELEPGSDPIAGRALDEHGRVCEFSSWLTLIAVLDELRRAPAASGGCPPVPTS